MRRTGLEYTVTHRRKTEGNVIRTGVEYTVILE